MILNKKETDSFGAERNLHYICGANGLAAIYVTTADKDTMYYAFTDYQHNLLALTDAAGKPYERYSYDPWGNRRSATDWTVSDTLQSHIVDRGYTLHEHLDEFGLINMNGRMYDPKLACFLSPDPVISDAGNWLDYNRYSYAWGNPLKYCDPTGMSETEGDHQRRRTERGNRKEEPEGYHVYQNGKIVNVGTSENPVQLKTVVVVGQRSQQSRFNSFLDQACKAIAKFQNGMDNSYNTGGYGRTQNYGETIVGGRGEGVNMKAENYGGINDIGRFMSYPFGGDSCRPKGFWGWAKFVHKLTKKVSTLVGLIDFRKEVNPVKEVGINGCVTDRKVLIERETRSVKGREYWGWNTPEHYDTIDIVGVVNSQGDTVQKDTIIRLSPFHK